MDAGTGVSVRGMRRWKHGARLGAVFLDLQLRNWPRIGIFPISNFQFPIMPHTAYSDPLYRLSDHAADGILVAEICDVHPIELARRTAVIPLYRDRGGESGDQLFRAQTMRRDARLVPDAE